MSQNDLVESLTRTLREINELVATHKWNRSNREHDEKWKKMVREATELHKLVKPKHHKYMLANRGVSPEDPAFYDHIHPVEDLLKFIEDPHANDDPEDQTIGHEFTFRVYSRRWGHDDQYRVRRTATGWDVHHIAIGGSCDKQGKPFLFMNFDQDSINYPEELPGYFEWLWMQAAEQGLTHDEVQSGLDQLAAWVSNCERQSPAGIFVGFK